jgi:hypothetical protein
LWLTFGLVLQPLVARARMVALRDEPDVEVIGECAGSH